MKKRHLIFLGLLLLVGAMLVATPLDAQRLGSVSEKAQPSMQDLFDELRNWRPLFARSTLLDEQQLVRVSLGQKLKTVQLETSGAVYVYTPDKAQRFRIKEDSGLFITFGSDKTVQLGNITSSDEIIIDPQPSSRLIFKNHVYQGVLHLVAEKNGIRVVEYNNVEDYLLGVVGREMYPSASIEALKAQTVAARSYALAKAKLHSKRSFDLVNTTADQRYVGVGDVADTTKQAVTETAGEVLFKSGHLLMAQYHANCGGQTEAMPEGYCYFGSPAMQGVSCNNCIPNVRDGHGMGMCQRGAMGDACQGMGYVEILQHYYPDATLEKIK